MEGYFEINPDEISEELKSALEKKYAGQLKRDEKLAPHTLEAENDAARVCNSRFLIGKGIEPTEENLERLQQEANEWIAEQQKKSPPKPIPRVVGVVPATNVIEMDEERKLNQAARELSDEIWPIREGLERVCLLLQFIADEYFRQYDRDDELDSFSICYEYSKYGRLANMAADYVADTRDKVRALEARAKQLGKAV